MHQSKLFLILKSFNRPEFGRFLDFVRSPYFNRLSTVTRLAEYLMPYFPDLDHPDLERKRVFEAVNPDLPYSDQRMYDLQSRLMKLALAFLKQEALSGSPRTGELLLMGELGRRELDYFFGKSGSKLRKEFDPSLRIDEHGFYQQYWLHHEEDLFFARFGKEKTRRMDHALQEKADNLDLMYLAGKFRNCCEMLNRQRVVSAPYTLRGLKDTLAFFEAQRPFFEQAPMISLYYTVLKSLLEPETEDHFDDLLDLLEQEGMKFPEEEARSLYGFAQNYCIRKINQGVPVYQERLFDLYRSLLETGLILEGGQLSQWDYKNIVSVGLRLKAFPWVLNFIESYQEKLDPAHRGNAYAYNLASLHYHQADFSKALRLLQSVRFTDVYYHLGTKAMLLKIYYEMDDHEGLEAHIQAFRTYLKRNRLISKDQGLLYSNLLDFCWSMFLLGLSLRSGSAGRDVLQTAVLKLDQEIRSCRAVANAGWLLEQLERLKLEVSA